MNPVDHVEIGTVLLAPSSYNRRERHVVIGATRLSWIVCRETSLPNPPEHMQDRIAKDTMVRRGGNGAGNSGARWVTEARFAYDHERNDLSRRIAAKLPKCDDLEKLRAAADLLSVWEPT